MLTKKEQEKQLKTQEKQIEKQEKKVEKQKDQIEEQKSAIKDLKKEMREIRKRAKEKNKARVAILKKEVSALRKQTKHQIVTLVTSAFGFVAALFWRDAIQAFLQQAFNISVGDGGYWAIQVGVALIITVFAAAVIYYVSKLESS